MIGYKFTNLPLRLQESLLHLFANRSMDVLLQCSVPSNPTEKKRLLITLNCYLQKQVMFLGVFVCLSVCIYVNQKVIKPDLSEFFYVLKA